MQDASSSIVMQDIIHQMVTDETFPMYNDDVASALSHSGNEFTVTPGSELMSQLQTGREECFQLGRGDCSPTIEDRKENSEERRTSILLDSLAKTKVETCICR